MPNYLFNTGQYAQRMPKEANKMFYSKVSEELFKICNLAFPIDCTGFILFSNNYHEIHWYKTSFPRIVFTDSKRVDFEVSVKDFGGIGGRDVFGSRLIIPGYYLGDFQIPNTTVTYIDTLRLNFWIKK